jgi:hypothetical protein
MTWPQVPLPSQRSAVQGLLSLVQLAVLELLMTVQPPAPSHVELA